MTPVSILTAIEALSGAAFTAALHLGAGLSLFALATALLNAALWPRGRAGARLPGGVSVLIPARNEARTIEAAVESALSSDHPVVEVIVCDDGSTDGTGELVLALADRDPRVRLIRGAPLPAGWVGKPHACHQLAKAARGDTLLFVDADTRLDPTGLGRLASLALRYQADVVTAVPRQRTGSLVERLVLPLLHVTYVSWLLQPLVWLTRDPRVLAANGQTLMIRRDAYDAIGGFEAVRGAVVDDMELCRAVKRAGRRVVFADGHNIALCRMYDDARGVWEGFSKNIYQGVGGSPLGLAAVVVLYTTTWIVPYLGLAGLALGAALPVGAIAVGVGASVTLRALLTLRHGHAPEGILLHPLAVAGLMGIALNSMRWSLAGRIQWRGRSYRITDGATSHAGGMP